LINSDMDTQFYTYIYRDPSRNSEPIYVGKGFGNRAWVHIKYSKKRHPFIQRLRYMKDNGVVPTIEIINALDESHAFLLEECLIGIMGRKDLKRGTLLNLTNGGEGNAGRTFSHTAETKEKMRIAKIGKPGHARSPESRKKISNYQKTRERTPDFCQKLRVKRPGTGIALSGRKRHIVECPHCNKSGGVGAMGRWHFNKCKKREV